MANKNESGSQNFDKNQQSQSSGMDQDLDITNRGQEQVGGASNTTGAGETSRGIGNDDVLDSDQDMNSDVGGTENFGSDDVNSDLGNRDMKKSKINDRSGNI